MWVPGQVRVSVQEPALGLARVSVRGPAQAWGQGLGPALGRAWVLVSAQARGSVRAQVLGPEGSRAPQQRWHLLVWQRLRHHRHHHHRSR